jgi:hypothetical protein
MDVRLINHSHQEQRPKGLCVLPPGRCQVSPEMFLAIEDDPALSDGRLEVIAKDEAELKKLREAKQAKAQPKAESAKAEAAPLPKRSSAKEPKK